MNKPSGKKTISLKELVKRTNDRICPLSGDTVVAEATRLIAISDAIEQAWCMGMKTAVNYVERQHRAGSSPLSRGIRSLITNATNLGGEKQLFSIGSAYTINNGY